jgi:hypothetical protein
MDIPLWGQKLLEKQDELSARVELNSTKIDQNSAKIDQNSVKIDQNSVKIDENSVKIDANSVKIDGLSVRVDGLSAKVDGLSVKVDALSAKVSEHDAFHADLMIFLRQQFADMHRHFDVALENMRSDQRAFGEQQHSHAKSLHLHSGRLEKLEDNEKVVGASLRGVISRVISLEK